MPDPYGTIVYNRIRNRFGRLYGSLADICMERLDVLFGRHHAHGVTRKPRSLWDESDVLLITYGDMVRQPDQSPLQTLDAFCSAELPQAFSAVHILPFFPYSSDDGFSIIDYRRVEPELGTWEDVQGIGNNFKLMVDLVLNHCSRQSEWFRDYIQGLAPFRDYFIEVEPGTDLCEVVRPRSKPLLTEVPYLNEKRLVWTTFSEDQIDLNFANPDVLFEFIDILLTYIGRGARLVRLDAIAYLWKQIGTSCIHLEQTHEIVKLFREIVRIAAPDVILLTETNVPHAENVSYFGRSDEAHMVYQFSLPPLLLHALQSGNGEYLTRWADDLDPPPRGCTFLNFTASHDGIGVRPLEGILPEGEIRFVLDRVRANGGRVSTKRGLDGSDTPYELNITYIDALARPGEPEDMLYRRYLCSQTLPLALRGLPAVYFNNLFGARNHTEGVEATGQVRAINRQKWDLDALQGMIHDRSNLHGNIFYEYRRRLLLRARQPALHPDAAQQVLDLGPDLFAVLRTATDDSQRLLCLHNLTDRPVEVRYADVHQTFRTNTQAAELLAEHPVDTITTHALEPYQTAWISQKIEQ
jgi:glycosidase